MEPQKSGRSGVDHRRLYWLDVARGIAVILVVLLHSTELTIPFVRETLSRYIGLGQIGVSVFFLVSGYIIPASIREGAPGRDFWIGRVLRIMPLYLISILAYAVIAAIQRTGMIFYSPVNLDFNAGNPRHLIGNLAPWQPIFRVPVFAALYWTLGVETMFYIVAFAMTSTRKLDAIWRWLPLLALGGTVAAIGLKIGRPAGDVPSIFYWLGVIFIGWAVRRYESGARAWTILPFALFVLTLAGLDLPHKEEIAAVPSATNTLFVNIVVTLLVGSAIYMVRERIVRRTALAWLGLISYSIYLDHPVAMGIASLTTNPFIFIPATFGLSIALAAATYRFIEVPAQAAAKALRGRFAPRAAKIENSTGAI